MKKKTVTGAYVVVIMTKTIIYRQVKENGPKNRDYDLNKDEGKKKLLFYAIPRNSEKINGRN